MCVRLLRHSSNCCMIANLVSSAWIVSKAFQLALSILAGVLPRGVRYALSVPLPACLHHSLNPYFLRVEYQALAGGKRPLALLDLDCGKTGCRECVQTANLGVPELLVAPCLLRVSREDASDRHRILPPGVCRYLQPPGQSGRLLQAIEGSRDSPPASIVVTPAFQTRTPSVVVCCQVSVQVHRDLWHAQ